MALAALGSTEALVQEPVHDHHSERLTSITERYYALRGIPPFRMLCWSSAYSRRHITRPF